MRATDRLAKLIAAIDKSIQEELYGHAAFTLRTPAAERLYRAPNDQVRIWMFPYHESRQSPADPDSIVQ